MYSYETRIVWKREKEGAINARQSPELRVATPPEFGGPSDAWSPLELLVASLGGCYLSTFLSIADKRAIRVRAFDATATGFVDTTPEGLRFKHIDVAIRTTVEDDMMAKKVMAAKDALKKICPVAAGLNFPVNLEMNVSVGK
jgi:organic hydroperoxide reductase OsmC/OhrA